MKLSKISTAILTTASLLCISQFSSAALNPTSEMLINLPPVPHHVERASVHFSQAIAAQTKLNLNIDQYSNVSDEYWFEVNGQQLNQGIELNISQPQALIRLSAKQSPGRGLPDNHGIDPQDLELRKGNQAIKQPFSQKVSREQLASANIFPNSSAVKIAKNAGTGTFKLKVTKALPNNQRYLVNIKEKGSAYQQVLSTQQQSYLAGQEIAFNVAINKFEHPVKQVKHSAYIKSPAGQKKPIAFSNKQGQFKLKIPLDLPTTKPGQLHELHIESRVHDGNITVKRVGKIAFAVAAPTARLTSNLSINQQQATFGLEVASDGRYEVSAIVYGHDKNKQLQPLMLSASAHYLVAGEHQVALKFDQKLLTSSALTAPYQLRSVKLTDQSRMAILQRQPTTQVIAFTD